MSKTTYELTKRQMEALQVVVRKGTEEAAAGLSGMVGREMTVVSPGIELANLTEIPEKVESPGEIAAGIYLQFEGDIHGQITLIFSTGYAMRLCDMLMGEPEGTTTEIGEMERSALGEVGNITSAYFLTALSKVTGLSLQPSPPAVIIDMCGAILGISIAEVGQQADEALMMETRLTMDEREVTGHFLVMPDPESLNTILESLDQ